MLILVTINRSTPCTCNLLQCLLQLSKVVADIVIYWRCNFTSCRTGVVMMSSRWNSFHLYGRNALSSSFGTFSKYDIEAISEDVTDHDRLISLVYCRTVNKHGYGTIKASVTADFHPSDHFVGV